MPSRDHAKRQLSGDQAAEQDHAADETVARPPERRARPRPVSAAAEPERTPGGDSSDGGARAGKRGNPARMVLPVLVSDEALLLPHMSIPLPIDDDETAAAVDRAMRMNPRRLLILTERKVAREGDVEAGEFDRDLIDIVSEMIARENEETGEFTELDADAGEEPTSDDADESAAFDGEAQEDEEYVFANVGVIAEIAQYITRPAGNDHIILQGIARGTVEQFLQDEPFIAAQVLRHEETVNDPAAAEAAMTTVLEQVENYISMLPNVPEEVLTMVRSVDDPGWLADLIAFSPEFSADQRQELLEILDPVERLHRLSVLIQKRINVLNLRHEIQSEAQAGMDKQQREYFLREQLRAINKELGEGSPDEMYATEMRKKIEAAGMPEEVKTKALVQVERLEQQHPYSPEIGVIRGYLEWLTELPWSIETEDVLDLDKTAAVLNEDHYGLDKVKERIVEYIAVRKLAGDKLRAPILCFVGPPGVGKTSLGRSIARSIGRNYVRMSLGGVRDEAEIRGHRRTYVGAMPGRVIKALRDAKSRNPVIVLDEIDKVGSDAFRGDPSSALLEVLDPEQNTTFSDHYLEVPFDLSRALFITTANMLDPIPAALRDRMEIIEVPGYTELEKLEIARQYLVPKSLESHGIKPTRLKVTDAAIQKIIREYTAESGVRGLEREIGALCRKAARRFAGNRPPTRLKVDAKDIQKYLGVPRYEFGLAEEKDEVGVTTGAAVTSAGGDLLSIEVILMEGKGDLMLTGQLGDVMQESARAALSYARSHASQYGLTPDFFDKHIIHVHIPAGAIPKDGPSAGITMATALISALTGVPVRKDVAMTGEVTLRGKVLPIGGLREKTLAAHRGGIKTFLLPKRNVKDLTELPELVRHDLRLIPVSTLDEVLEHALVHPVGASAGDPRKPAGRESRTEPALPVTSPTAHGPAAIRVAAGA